MLRIAVVEDRKEYRDQLSDFLKQFSAMRNIPLQCKLFPTGSDFLNSESREYDILLLDINLPDMTGMDIAREIRKTDEQTVIMFITEMAQYAIEGYSVGALDFLLKPINYQAFSIKFSRAVKRVQSREGALITLTLPGGIKRLSTQDIYYVEIQNHTLKYHTAQGEYSLRGTMQSAEETLTPFHFAKCSHWYLVNLAHVSEVQKDTVLVSGNQLDISRRNRSAFLAAVTNYIGGHT